MPKSWNESTVVFKAFWTAASGSGGVAFGLAARAHSNDDAMDQAVSGQQIVTGTTIATETQFNVQYSKWYDTTVGDYQ